MKREENEWIYFIGKNVPSKKNAKTWTGYRLISNKTVKEYETLMDDVWKTNKSEWDLQYNNRKSNPVYVEFYFYRDSRRKYDFVNIVQEPADLMQKYDYIPDDDTKNFIPVYVGEELTSKDKAGFKMRIRI